MFEGSGEAKISPWEPAGRDGIRPTGVGRGGALPVGPDEACPGPWGSEDVKTSSSAWDETGPGPWGSDEAETLSSASDEVVVASLTIG